MATLEQISALVSQVAPILDPLAIDVITEEKTWGILMEEDLAVLIQLDEEKNCLVLVSELGTPPPGDQIELYEILLQMNYHWDTTGGMRMALTGPGGQVVQIFEIGAEEVNATELTGILLSFADAAKAWRKIVQCSAAAESGTCDMATVPGIRI